MLANAGVTVWAFIWASWPYVLAMLLLIVTSAICSGYEAAFFSLVRSLGTKSLPTPLLQRFVGPQRRNPQQLLATLLLTNNLANIGLVMVTAFLLTDAHAQLGGPIWAYTLIELVGITLLILVFGEVSPKVYASRAPQVFLGYTSPVIWLFGKLMFPVSWVLARLSKGLYYRLEDTERKASIAELQQAIDLTNDRESPPEEKTLLKSILNLENVTVRSVMRSRVDMVGVDADATAEQVLETLISSKYSRLPVLGESKDEVLGLLYLKDVLRWQESGSTEPWQSLMRPAFFVPETQKLARLFNQFKKKRLHLAIVVDEYGGTSGLVSLQDVLEFVFGENHNPVVQSADGTYLFPAKKLLLEVARQLDIAEDSFDEWKGESETLGGLLLEISGRFPQEGETFQAGQFQLVAEELGPKGLERVRLVLKPGPDETH